MYVRIYLVSEVTWLYSIPAGFKSILSYDPLTKTIRWRILGGEDDIHAEEEKAMVELSRDRQDKDGTGVHRPFTAGPRESPRHVIDRDLFEQYVSNIYCMAG